MVQILWSLYYDHTLDYAALIWDEFKLQITSRRIRPTKADKLPFLRFTKLIIARIMSTNTTINQRSNAKMYRSEMDERYKPAKVAKEGVIYYGLEIPDTMLNDTIHEMNVYKEYVENKDLQVKQKKALNQELLRGRGEGSGTRIQTQELRDSLDSDQTLSATRLDVVDEGDMDDASNFTVLVDEKMMVAKEKSTPILTTISSPRTQSSQDNVSRYLNENPAPSLEDVGLPRIEGTSGLNLP
ncbi:hypothetical protein Tco_0126874 [Tanacetum coccineum]